MKFTPFKDTPTTMVEFIDSQGDRLVIARSTYGTGVVIWDDDQLMFCVYCSCTHKTLFIGGHAEVTNSNNTVSELGTPVTLLGTLSAD